MIRYRYYAVDCDRNELADGTVDAESLDAAFAAATTAIEERRIECADIDVIEDA